MWFKLNVLLTEVMVQEYISNLHRRDTTNFIVDNDQLILRYNNLNNNDIILELMIKLQDCLFLPPKHPMVHNRQLPVTDAFTRSTQTSMA